MFLNKKNIEDIYALSALQEGILFHHINDEKGRVYFSQLLLDLEGNISLSVFRNAWHTVIKNNEILRTVFRWAKISAPVQVVLKKANLNLRYIDLSNSPNKESTIEQIRVDDKNKGFDLLKVPFRIVLIKCSSSSYKCIISNHLILYDGWSNGIIINEFFSSYNELFGGRELTQVNKVRFKKYIKYDLEIRKLQRHHEFWKDYLKDIKQNDFKLNTTNELINDYRSFGISLSSEMSEELKKFSRYNKTTIANVFYCAWGILLMNYKKSNDVVFGTTISVRDFMLNTIDQIVGLLINTIPLRFNFENSESIDEIIRKADYEIKNRQPHQHLPLQFILDNVPANRNKEVFDTIFIVENYPISETHINSNENIKINSFSIEESSNYKLAVSVILNSISGHDGNIKIKFYYNKAKINSYYTDNISDHFTEILEVILNNKHSVLSDMNIASNIEKEHSDNNLNNTRVESY